MRARGSGLRAKGGALLLSLSLQPLALSPAVAEPVTVVFRHGKVSGFEGLFRRLLDRFEAAHPDIKVKEETLPWDAGQQHQLYAINLESGSDMFDVMALDIVWVAEFGRAGWARELSELWPVRERAAFLPSTVEAATYHGRFYALPWFTDAGLLYYRKDLLEKYGLPVPGTWPELAAAARTVLDGEKDPRLTGFVWQGKQYEGLVCDALEYLQSNGVRMLDEKGRWAADPARSVAALTFMRDLIYETKVSPELVLAGDEESARQIFGNGQAVFMRNWPYAYGIYSKPGAEIAGRFGIAALPRFDGGVPAPTLGGWFLAVNGYSKHPEEAFEVARYMTSPEVQKEMFLTLSYLPTRSALYKDKDLLAQAPQLKVFGGFLPSARPRPVTPFYPSLSDIMQSEFSAALARIRSPEKAIRNIGIQVRPILEEGQ